MRRAAAEWEGLDSVSGLVSTGLLYLFRVVLALLPKNVLEMGLEIL